MTNLAALSAANAQRWANAKMTRGPELVSVAKRLVAAKNRYLYVASKTGVPWFFIAVAHEREGSQNWNGSLAQGDPWNRKSVHVPAGRGPFTSWEAAAIDALTACAPFAARNTDWSVGGLLTMLEQYNGLGYANRGAPSPYIWSGTDQYTKGKYVADGKFDPNEVDKQLGCAGLIMAMQALDPSIAFGRKSIISAPAVIAKTGQPVIAAHPSSVPSISNPAPGSIGAKLVSLFSSLFKKAA
jgi:lysozyme family protein